MFKKLKNWLIRKLGGIVAIEVTAQSEIKIDPLFGYTEDNVITQAKAQTIYELGKAVYPYAHHFITPDGVYIASVEVLKGETE